jgi:hypothetical protein
MAMAGLSELNAQVADLVGRIKPSERRLLGLLVLAALIILPLKAFSLVEAAQNRNDEAQTALAAVHQVLWRGQGGVAGRVAGETAQVKAWSWQADSADIGKVLIQNDIATLANKAGMADVDVKVDDKLQSAGQVKLVSLEMTAPFSWPALSGFLTALDATGKGFILDQAQLPDDDKPRLKLLLRAPLLITAVAPKVSGSARSKPLPAARS